MFIRLLKAIAELVYVSVRLAYVFVFYPSKPSNRKNAEKVLDPEYNPTEYGSGETGEALKMEWIHDSNMDEEEESRWRQSVISDVTDYNYDPMIIEPTKKILAES